MMNTYLKMCLLAVLASSTLWAQAQTKSAFLNKVDPKLRSLTTQSDQSPPSTPPNADHARTSQQSSRKVNPLNQPGMMVAEGYVLVDATAVDNATELLRQLEALGLRNGAAFGGMVSGWLPVDSVEKLSEIAQLRFVCPSYAKARIGTTTSQGDQTLFSDKARSQFKVTGRGNKIGVISDSYDDLEGAATGVAGGDLPGENNPNGYLHPVAVLEEAPFDFPLADEGRAMIEIIHDIAPGAEILFHTGFAGQANFAQGIIDLADAGANIIVDDVGYFEAPFFQEGIITQATEMVADRGVAYFSSASNEDRGSYESVYRPTPDTIVLPLQVVTDDTAFISSTPYIFHDFDPGPGVDIFQEVAPIGFNYDEVAPELGEGFVEYFGVAFQWDEPFASVCEGCPGSKSDLDIFIAFKEDTGAIAYELSAFADNLGGDASELLYYFTELDSASSGKAYLLIGKNVGNPDTPDPHLIKYIGFDGSAPTEYVTNSSTVFGHPNGKQVISVGASDFYENPLYFPEQYPLPLAAEYSSVGGTPILFDRKGNRMEPIIREKPDVVGPASGNTTFFSPGNFLEFAVPGTTEPDTFPQFPGTSAAAPHVAAVAALMNEAAGKQLSPDTIAQVMEQTATDLDDPFTEGFDEGFDFKTGLGYVNAQKAVASVYSLPSVVSFTLINATTDKEISPLGNRVDLSQVEGGLINIRADVITGTGEVGSVFFDLKGPQEQEKIENAQPYALFSDNKGDYSGRALALGKYMLTATPYTDLLGRGESGVPLTVSFEVTRFPVEQLVLIDATTDQAIRPLLDGEVINLTTYPQVTVAALPEFDNFKGRIEFLLNGKLVQCENLSPYALAGDDLRGNYNAYPFEPGEYTLTVIPYSEDNNGGLSGDSLTVDFTIVREPEVVALLLIEAATGQVLDTLSSEATLRLDSLPDINIRAVVNDELVGSVEFEINGAVFSRDNEAPYLLYDKAATTDLPPGDYRLTAVPYSQENGLGIPGIPLSVQIRLDIDLAITAFVLVDAEKDEPIGLLSTGDTLDVSLLPPFTIEAIATNNVESVGFSLNGERVKVENYAPYTLAGNRGTDYEPADLDIGYYVLEATPYGANNLVGTVGAELTLAFAVISTQENGIPPFTKSIAYDVYPNPVARELTVQTKSGSETIVHYSIIDPLGRTLASRQVAALNSMHLDITPYLSQISSAGLFYLKVISSEGHSETFKMKLE